MQRFTYTEALKCDTQKHYRDRKPRQPILYKIVTTGPIPQWSHSVKKFLDSYRDPDHRQNPISCCYSRITTLQKFVNIRRQLFEFSCWQKQEDITCLAETISSLVDVTWAKCYIYTTTTAEPNWAVKALNLAHGLTRKYNIYGGVYSLQLWVAIIRRENDTISCCCCCGGGGGWACWSAMTMTSLMDVHFISFRRRRSDVINPTSIMRGHTKHGRWPASSQCWPRRPAHTTPAPPSR